MSWLPLPNFSNPLIPGINSLARYEVTSSTTGSVELLIQQPGKRFSADPVSVFTGQVIGEVRISYYCCANSDPESPQYLEITSYWRRTGNSALQRAFTTVRKTTIKLKCNEENAVIVDSRLTQWVYPFGSCLTTTKLVPDYFWCSLKALTDFGLTFTMPSWESAKKTLEEGCYKLRCDQDNDCPEGSEDCDEFEEECPETSINFAACNVFGDSITSVGNSYYRGYGSINPTIITRYFRDIDLEIGLPYCRQEVEQFDDFDTCTYKTIYIDPAVYQQYPIGSPQRAIAIANEFTRLYCLSSCKGEGEEPQDEHTHEDDNSEQDDKPCGLYVDLELVLGVKFTYLREIPGQEAEEQIRFAYALYTKKFRFDLPISLTNSQARLLSLFDPELEVELDFTGISISIGFSLKIGSVEISGSRFERSIGPLLWSVIFPEFSPFLVTLQSSPVSPFAKLGLVGLGRHNC